MSIAAIDAGQCVQPGTRQDVASGRDGTGARAAIEAPEAVPEDFLAVLETG